jgi:hypothetical protein
MAKNRTLGVNSTARDGAYKIKYRISTEAISGENIQKGWKKGGKQGKKGKERAKSRLRETDFRFQVKNTVAGS